jgi:hypothetical protein
MICGSLIIDLRLHPKFLSIQDFEYSEFKILVLDSSSTGQETS